MKAWVRARHHMTEIEKSGPLGSGPVRLLKIAVVVMGVLILAGLAAIAARVFYLASRPARQPSGIALAAAGQARLALPDGAVVRHVALSGDRLAVTYEHPGGTAIAILDLATGETVRRIEVVPEPPRR